MISEYEPIEAFALLTNDDLDLALTYDYNLAPASPGPVLRDRRPVVGSVGTCRTLPTRSDRAADIAAYADRAWIVNSRNTADEDAVRTLASLAGFSPHIAHEIDSLDLVEDLIVAGFGVGLLPIGRPTHPGVTVSAAVGSEGGAHRLRGDSAGSDRRGRRCGWCLIGCARRRVKQLPRPQLATPGGGAVIGQAALDRRAARLRVSVDHR